MNKKISVAVVLILLVIIGVESATILPYHSSNSYEVLSSDLTQNATGYIVISKLPSSSVDAEIYMCDISGTNISVSLPSNSSAVQISEIDFSNSVVSPHLKILFNSSSLSGIKETTFFTKALFSNLSLFNPVSVRFITGHSYTNIRKGVYKQYGFEYLVVATRSVNQIYYKQVNR